MFFKKDLLCPKHIVLRCTDKLGSKRHKDAEEGLGYAFLFLLATFVISALLGIRFAKKRSDEQHAASCLKGNTAYWE